MGTHSNGNSGYVPTTVDVMILQEQHREAQDRLGKHSNRIATTRDQLRAISQQMIDVRRNQVRFRAVAVLLCAAAVVCALTSVASLLIGILR